MGINGSESRKTVLKIVNIQTTNQPTYTGQKVHITSIRKEPQTPFSPILGAKRSVFVTLWLTNVGQDGEKTSRRLLTSARQPSKKRVGEFGASSTAFRFCRQSNLREPQFAGNAYGKIVSEVKKKSNLRKPKKRRVGELKQISLSSVIIIHLCLY